MVGWEPCEEEVVGRYGPTAGSWYLLRVTARLEYCAREIIRLFSFLLEMCRIFKQDPGSGAGYMQF